MKRILLAVFMLVSVSGMSQEFTVSGHMAVALGGGLVAAEAGYNTDKTQYSLSIFKADGEIEGNSAEDINAFTTREFITASSQGLGLGARYFPSDGTFNVSTRARIYNITGEYGIKNDFQKESLDYTAKALSMDVSIGNQWQYESGFFIGCDWIGIGTSLVADTAADEDSSAENIISTLLPDYQSRIKDAVVGISKLTVLNFYIGTKI